MTLTATEHGKSAASKSLTEAAALIDTNVLLGRLKAAAAAATATLEAEAAAAAAAEVTPPPSPAAEAIRAMQRHAERLHEQTAVERLHAAREAVRDPATMDALAAIDASLQDAHRALAKVAEVTTDVGGGKRGGAQLPSWALGEHPRARRVKFSAHAELMSASGRLDRVCEHALDGTDDPGIISAYTSEVTGRRARDLAAAGRLQGLEEIQRERKEWPCYLTLSSWDGQCSRHGHTVLMLASKHGHTACVEKLLSWGADPNLVADSHTGATALHLAANRHVAEALLRYGADARALDSLGRTPFMIARQNHLGGGGGGTDAPADTVLAFTEPWMQITSRTLLLERREREQALLLAAGGGTVASGDGGGGSVQSWGDGAQQAGAAAVRNWCQRATQRRAVRREAERLFHLGLGALSLEDWTEAEVALNASLAADANSSWSDLAREKLGVLAEQRAAQQLQDGVATTAAAAVDIAQ
jgi:hypothetical protein